MMKSALFAGAIAALVSETYGARPLPIAKRAPTGASFSMQRGSGFVPHRSSKSTASQGSSLGDSNDLLVSVLYTVTPRAS